jgi:hypothetical protein
MKEGRINSTTTQPTTSQEIPLPCAWNYVLNATNLWKKVKSVNQESVELADQQQGAISTSCEQFFRPIGIPPAAVMFQKPTSPQPQAQDLLLSNLSVG